TFLGGGCPLSGRGADSSSPGGAARSGAVIVASAGTMTNLAECMAKRSCNTADYALGRQLCTGNIGCGHCTQRPKHQNDAPAHGRIPKVFGSQLNDGPS